MHAAKHKIPSEMDIWQRKYEMPPRKVGGRVIKSSVDTILTKPYHHPHMCVCYVEHSISESRRIRVCYRLMALHVAMYTYVYSYIYRVSLDDNAN